MNYKDYQKSRDAAWRILIDCQVHSLPVDIGEICRRLGVTVKEYILEDGNDGACFMARGRPIILVNPNATEARQRFTVAHELGHLILGHVGKYQLCNREPSKTDDRIEHEANVFASRLLAPACVLWGCHAASPEEISKLCSISITAAGFRAERMAILLQRNKFLISPLERQVYSQFREFIRQTLASGS